MGLRRTSVFAPMCDKCFSLGPRNDSPLAAYEWAMSVGWTIEPQESGKPNMNDKFVCDRCTKEAKPKA